jgi:hypothetical protein
MASGDGLSRGGHDLGLLGFERRNPLIYILDYTDEPKPAKGNVMKGPAGRIKFDLRRWWHCPVCHAKRWTGGHVTSLRCPRCAAHDPPRETWMTPTDPAPRKMVQLPEPSPAVTEPPPEPPPVLTDPPQEQAEPGV